MSERPSIDQSKNRGCNFLYGLFHIFSRISEPTTPQIVIEVTGQLEQPTDSKPPTCSELLSKIYSPDHPSQDQFALLKDGRMLDGICQHNGYTFGPYPKGVLRHPNFARLRAEARLHDLASRKL